MATIDRFNGFIADPTERYNEVYIQGFKVTLDSGKEILYSAKHTTLYKQAANLYVVESDLSYPPVSRQEIDTSTAADPAAESAKLENFTQVQSPISTAANPSTPWSITSPNSYTWTLSGGALSISVDVSRPADALLVKLAIITQRQQMSSSYVGNTDYTIALRDLSSFGVNFAAEIVLTAGTTLTAGTSFSFGISFISKQGEIAFQTINIATV